VSLEDVFATCLLLRVDARYEQACVRWIERFAGKVERAGLHDLCQAAPVFQLLPHGRTRRELAPTTTMLRRHGG
jgi:hypothetical protein